jgi:acetolactate synthase-1/2/3 large subunit
MSEKYGEHFIDWLVEEGYTTCFFVAGGNTMHLLAAAIDRLVEENEKEPCFIYSSY